MKKLIIPCILFILLATPTIIAESSITVEATINESVVEDTLLNSPFLILGAIIIANIIMLIYRKVRK